MSENERFTLEGVTYYQQFRKCGKSSCTVCNSGKGHGPYWYCRDVETKKRQYIGKELPSEVVHARKVHDRALTKMMDLRQAALNQYSALTALMRNEKLTEAQEQIIKALGLGECLTSYRLPGPDIRDLPVDQRLRSLGYSRLPGVE